MKKRIIFCVVLFLMIFSFTNIFAERLFYISTDRTYSPYERKRIKIESGYSTDSLKIRIYKINDTKKFYLSQSDFHRPKITGREFRYYTPEVIEGFNGYFKGALRDWARNNIPAENRNSILNKYPDFSQESKEEYYEVKRIVNVIEDSNYVLLKEVNYVLEDTRNDWNYNYVFLDDLNEGTYLIEGISRYNVAYTVLNVSNYGFIAKKANNNILLYTVDNLTGEPVENIELTIFNRFKKELKRTKSGKNGIAITEIDENDLFILGKSGDNVYTFFDPKYFPANVRDHYVYIYTDRPVYKGGDEVFIKGIYRYYKDDKYFLKNAGKVKVEIYDGRGNVVKTFNTSSDDSGIFSGKFILPDKAQAGRYLIIANFNDKKYEAEFKVEYYQKPEFEVKIRPKERVYISGELLNFSVSAKYYFGDAVKDGKVRYSVYRTRFSGEEWTEEQDKNFYLSEQEYVYSKMELLKTGEAKLDSEGNVDLAVDTIKDNVAYYYNIQARVTDQTGVPISGGTNVMVVPAEYKINLRTNKFVYVKNEKVVLEIKTSDYLDNPLSKKIDIYAVSETEDSKKPVLIDKRITTDTDGYAKIEFKASKNGFVKITATGKDKMGNEAVTEKYLWIGEEGASYNYKGGLVKLVLDKKSYKIGEEAKLLILSPVSDIKYLLTIEGDLIYSNKVDKLDSNSTLITIPIKKNYLPNVYADVSFMFNNKLYNNTIKITVPPVDQFLNIEINPEKNTFKPRSKGNVIVKVTDKNKKPVENTDVSIAVVDEAIYGISSEIAIDIHKYFYPFRRNNIMTWSSIGYRFYGYSMNANTELAYKFYKDPNGLASFKEGEEEKERKEFKDSILWIPSLKTDKNGFASFEVEFPDNITKWRITAVAVSPDTKVGRNVNHVVTKLEFFAKIAAPAYFDEYDKSSVYGVLYNQSKEKINADVWLSGENFDYDNKKQSVSIEAGGSQFVKWDVMPKEVGEIELKLKADGGKYKDAVVKKIPVIPHSILKSVMKNKEINSKTNSFTFKKPSGIKEKGQSININLSYGYASVIIDSLPYLATYPYGCVEQTTSSFMPNLVCLNALKKIGVKLPELEKKIPEHIDAGLSKLYGYQREDGAWGWWQDDRIDIFMTSYVMYALYLTQKAGYKVSENVIKNGLKSLDRNISRAGNNTSSLYALYVLSLYDRKYSSLFDSIMKNYKNLNPYDLALLTLTANNYKRSKEAKKLVEELKKSAKPSTDKNKTYWGENFSTDWSKDNIETTAWVIRAINSIEPNSIYVRKGVNWLIGKKEGDRWKSTRDTAAVVLTISDLFDNVRFVEAEYDVRLNDKSITKIRFNKNNFKTFVTLDQADFEEYLSDTNTVKVVGPLGRGDRVFISMAFNYYTDQPEITAGSKGFDVQRNYYSLREIKDGDKIKYARGNKINSVKKGENFLIELIVDTDKNYNYVMVEEYMPAGCIPVKDFLLYNIEGLDKKRVKPDFIDYRYDKAVFFLDSARSARLYYVVTGVYTGEYRVMPASASLMYFPGVRGNSSDDNLIIK